MRLLRKSRPLLYSPKIRITDQSREAQIKQAPPTKCLDVYIVIESGARITVAQAREQINRANRIWNSANVRFNLVRISTNYNFPYNSSITYPPGEDLLRYYSRLRSELKVRTGQAVVVFSRKTIRGASTPIDPTAFAFITVINEGNRTLKYPSVFADNSVGAGSTPNLLAHELGHLLFANSDGRPPSAQPSNGIPHSLNRSNVMYPLSLSGTVNTSPAQRALAYRSSLLRTC